jgi:hypothetical protein
MNKVIKTGVVCGLREESRLRIFGNRVLRRILGLRRTR